MDSMLTCEESTEDKCIQVVAYPIVMTKRRIKKNLLIICLGFMLLFGAYFSLAILQSTMNDAGSVGVISQSTIYAALMISSLFLPEYVIRKVGCKRALVFSILTYAPYIATNIYPDVWTLLPTAVLLGIGGSILLSTAQTFVNQLSFMDAKEDLNKAARSTSRFFGIFQMSVKTTQIWGNLVSFYVLRPSNVTQSNESFMNGSSGPVENISCGASFCGSLGKTLQPISDEKRYILVGIHFCLCVLSAIVIALFLDSLKKRKGKRNIEEDWKKTLSKFLATLKQMRKVDQLFLAVLTTFSGLTQGFVFGDYSQAYVACALGMENVGLVFAVYGVVASVTAFSVGYIFKYVPRVVIMTVAALSHMGLFWILLFWKFSHHYSSYFIVAGFWAFSESIWTTQLTALHGVLFRSQEEAAFANYRFFDSLGYAIAFSCNSLLCIPTKIYMLITFLVFGMVAYLAVELELFKEVTLCSKKFYTVPSPKG